MIYRGTSYVLNDEPCVGIAEQNYKTPDEHSINRYRIIWVIRDDKIAEHRIDLGDSKKFKAGLFYVPTMQLHTVGEAIDIANDIQRIKWDKKDMVGVDQIKE